MMGKLSDRLLMQQQGREVHDEERRLVVVVVERLVSRSISGWNLLATLI